MSRRSTIWGNTTSEEPLVSGEADWEAAALQDAYLPSLSDRLRRNRGFDAEVFTS